MSTQADKSTPVDRKSTQRERLIAGMIAAAHRHGYAGANVAHVIAEAGVSRPTFYEYFADKDDCFLAAHRELSRLLIWEIRRAVDAVEPERAVQAAIHVLIRLCEEYPDRADFPRQRGDGRGLARAGRARSPDRRHRAGGRASSRSGSTASH